MHRLIIYYPYSVKVDRQVPFHQGYIHCLPLAGRLFGSSRGENTAVQRSHIMVAQFPSI
jgi:hypothetical protein